MKMSQNINIIKLAKGNEIFFENYSIFLENNTHLQLIELEQYVSIDRDFISFLANKDDSAKFGDHARIINFVDMRSGLAENEKNIGKTLFYFGKWPSFSLKFLQKFFENKIEKIVLYSSHDNKFKIITSKKFYIFSIILRIIEKLMLKSTYLFFEKIWRRLWRMNRRQIIKSTISASEKQWKATFSYALHNHLPTLQSVNLAPRIILACGSLAAGGAERQASFSALGIKRRFADTSVVCTSLDGNAGFFAPELVNAGIRLDQLPPLSTSSLADLTYARYFRMRQAIAGDDAFTKEIFRFAQFFWQERPDVVHTWLDWTNCTAGLGALIAGVPRIVLSCRSLSPLHFDFHQNFMRPAYRHLLAHPRVRLLNNSVAGAYDYTAWLGINQEQTGVIPNAVDTTHFTEATDEEVSAFRREFAIPDASPLVGSVFRINEVKRPKLWLEIAAAVAARRPDARFLLVGDGDIEAVRAQAQDLGIAERLILTGRRRDVAVALKAMSCFLLTSRVEGFPNVLLEAQLAGLRVVTSKVGGAVETFADPNLSGYAVDSQDVGAYAQKILDVLDDHVLLARCRTELPQAVRQRFAFDTMINRTLEAYGLGQDRQTKSLNRRM